MIDIMLNHANELVIVRVNGQVVTFGNTTYGPLMASIEGLRLDYHGTVREFPDLKNEVNWREKAIERFKKKIATLQNEDAIANYIVDELRTKGYIPKLKQRGGFRPVRIE